MTITPEQIAARARQNAEAQALADLQREQQAREAREREARARIEADYGAAVAAARAQLDTLSDLYAERDRLAAEVGPMLARLETLHRQIGARRADALRPALERGRPLGFGFGEVEQHTGAAQHPHGAARVEGGDAGAKWARFVVRLVDGHVALMDDGRGAVTVATRTTLLDLDY